MQYQFYFQPAQGIFALPCEVVDVYINEAAGDDLKVLLYIFRHSETGVQSEKLCKDLSLAESRVQKAIEFWANKKIFTYKQTGGSQETEPVGYPAAKKPARIIDSPSQYSAEEIAERTLHNPEIKFLMDAVPDMLGKLISPAECSALIYLYEGAGLPADVILMAIEYCVTTGHSNMRYIEKMALSWSEEGINSHEKAENKIRELESRHSFETKIKSLMGISSRALTQAERQHMNRWLQWSMTPELIKAAYDICVNRTGKLSFSYMNSILNAWHEKGYKTPEETKKEKRQNRYGKNPSYNIDEYVNLSMKRLLDE